MGFGDRQRIGMCCRTAPTKPIFSRKEMKTAIPPNGVTARCVSRRINRSFDNSAVISRGTGLSVAFDSIPLLSQILGRNPTSNFGFSGNWVCRGVFLADYADVISGAAALTVHTTQLFLFTTDDTMLVTEGLEGNVGVSTHRVVTGGTGAYAGATGQSLQQNIGVDQDGKGLFDRRFNFQIDVHGNGQ